MLTRAYVWAEPKECLEIGKGLLLHRYADDAHPTCIILQKVCVIPGNVPLRSIIVISAKAATSKKAWISFKGSP